MAALTGATLVSHKEEAKIVQLPVAETVVIYQGALLMLDGDGYVAPCAPTSGTKFAGIAAEGVDNTSGSDGDVNVDVFISGLHKLVPSGVAVTDVFGKVYAETDNPADVSLESGSPTTDAQMCGQIVELPTSTEAFVDISVGVQQPELAT